MEDADKRSDDALESPARRRMLSKAGKYAIATPPTVSFLLSTAMAGQHVAKSGGNETWWNNGPRKRRRGASGQVGPRRDRGHRPGYKNSRPLHRSPVS